jgi:hypothetical protein
MDADLYIVYVYTYGTASMAVAEGALLLIHLEWKCM